MYSFSSTYVFVSISDIDENQSYAKSCYDEVSVWNSIFVCVLASTFPFILCCAIHAFMCPCILFCCGPALPFPGG